MTAPRFQVGLVGAGQIAPHHVAALRGLPGVALRGVVDLDGERAARFAREHGVPEAFASLDAMAAAGVNVVHVLTPPEGHVPVAIDAVRLGCDVLVEKPLATQVGECDALRAEAERHGRRVAVNHSLLWDAQVRRALAAVRSGRIGTPVSAEYLCHSEYPPWAGGPLPPHYQRGGNPFRDLGVHGLYLLRACLGDVHDLHVDRRSLGGDPNLPFDEWSVLVTCAAGAGRIMLSWNARPLQTVFTVHGTAGAVRADIGCMVTTARRVRPVPEAVGRMVNVLEEAVTQLASVPANATRFAAGRLKPYQGLRASVAAFYRGLAGDGPLPATLADGRHTVAWVEAAAGPADVAARRRAAPVRDPRPATVVTGATGVLGTALVRRLLARGERVRVLVRRAPVAGWAGTAEVELAYGDLGDARAVHAALRNATAVYHVGAAMRGGTAEHTRGTVAGTAHVVDACIAQDVPRLVHVSSLSVLALGALDPKLPVDEDAPLEPAPERRGAYTQAKLAAERIVSAAVRERGLRAVIVRPGALVGGAAPLTAACNTLEIGRRRIVLGRGHARLPLVHVDDVVEALVRAAACGPWDGSVYHVVDRPVWRQAKLAARLAAQDGRRVLRVPQPVAWTIAIACEAATRLLHRTLPLNRDRLRASQADLRFDCRKAKTVLGWTPAADLAALAALPAPNDPGGTWDARIDVGVGREPALG